MEVVNEYVSTEIGKIPSDWNLVQLGQIGQAIIGLTYSPDDVSNFGILVHRSSNIQNNQLAYYDNVYVNVEINKKLILKENDILICVRNGSRDLIGKSAIIKGKSIGETFGAFMSVFRTTENATYIFNLIISEIVQRQISQSLGATINQITNKTLNAIKIALPPLPEQQAIAEILSDTDNLIQSLEKQIVKKHFIKQGAMQKLLTPKEGWEKAEIQKIASISTGSKNTQDRIDDGEYPFFVRSQTVERINSYSFDGEAVLTAGDGVGTGKIFHYINGKFDYHQRVYKMSQFDKQIDGYYFYLFFMNNFFNRITQMTAKSSVDSIRYEMIAKMEIPFPCRLEQEAIAKTLLDMGTEISILEKKLMKYKSLKQGLMQNLLTGKIRLITT